LIMPVEQELASIIPARPTLLSIGAFDGVHLGHQALLNHLVNEAKRQELIPSVITFRQHPLQFLSPGSAPRHIESLAQNISLIRALGVEIVIALTFDAGLAHIEAQTFVLLLQRYLKMRGLILGWDFAMGYNRRGTLAELEKLGIKLGFDTEIMPPVRIDGEIVSSTAIRQAVVRGDVAGATAMLGRFFSIQGRVISGSGRGSSFGIPTANLDIDPLQLIPAEGVYASLAHVSGVEYHSVTAISRCPTFGGSEQTVEVHIFDFDHDIYCETLQVDIIERLRGVQRFETVAGLVEQIERDIREAKSILGPGSGVIEK
jgi:riboflavin kinase/FMN adenylyltransferase